MVGSVAGVYTACEGLQERLRKAGRREWYWSRSQPRGWEREDGPLDSRDGCKAGSDSSEQLPRMSSARQGYGNRCVVEAKGEGETWSQWRILKMLRIVKYFKELKSDFHLGKFNVRAQYWEMLWRTVGHGRVLRRGHTGGKTEERGIQFETY